jgi:hypothetical protein
MGASNKAHVEVHFADGSVIRAFESFTMRESFVDPLGEFSFTVAPLRTGTSPTIAEYSERLQKGSLVRVYANNALQGAWIIQTVNVNISRENAIMFSFTCQSTFAPSYEGGVDPKISYHGKASVPVSDVLLQALGPYGFDRLVGDTAASVDAVTGKPIGNRAAAIVVDALKHNDAQAHDGETAYQFCARIITRLGVAIRPDYSDPRGTTILVSAPDYDQEPGYSVHQTFGAPRDGDRFLSLEIIDTNDGQFSSCECRGVRRDREGSTQSAEPKSTVLTTDLSTKFPPYVSSHAPHKPKYLLDKSAADVRRAKNTATLALGLPAKNAFIVRGTVDGMVSRTGRLWASDTIANVYIEAPVVRGTGLNDTMYLLSKTFRQDRSGAQSTALDFIPRGALQLGEV